MNLPNLAPQRRVRQLELKRIDDPTLERFIEALRMIGREDDDALKGFKRFEGCGLSSVPATKERLTLVNEDHGITHRGFTE